MRRSLGLRGALVVLAVLAAAAAGGCSRNTLVFGTATKFGLDIAQRPDQLVEVTMGYDRLELASIPATASDATAGGDDTYAVLGVFSFSYGNPWGNEPLVLRQLFATGFAARAAAQNPAFQRLLGREAGEIARQAEQEIEAERRKAEAGQ